MSELVSSEVTGEPAAVTDRAPESDADPDAAAARIRARAERVRARELSTALDRLAASDEIAPAQRRVLAEFATEVTDALVEDWLAGLEDEAADPAVAVELLTEA